MADDANDGENGNRGTPSSDEAALSARLGSLDHRLSKIRNSRNIRTDQPGTEGGDGAARASAMARGLRLSSELIAGVVVGAVIGWVSTACCRRRHGDSSCSFCSASWPV